jgi:hypothetical protein
MKFYLPKTLVISDSNIAYNEDENGNLYTEYNKMSGYNKGLQAYYNWNLYTSLTTIYPMVNYIWEDLIVTDKYAFDVLNENRFPTPSAVPCVSGVTVVYVRSLDSYYKAKTTGNINFTIENPVTHANFDKITTAIIPYNYEFSKPSGTENTIYWAYDGVANRGRVFDNAIGTATSYNDEIYFKFTTNGMSALNVFSPIANTVRVKITDIVTTEIYYDETLDTVDVSNLDDYEKVCTLEAEQRTALMFTFEARYAQVIEITATLTGGVVSLGAIKAGAIESLGKTIDGVDVTNKSYNEVTQRSNGEYVWNVDNSESNKVFIISYNMLIPSNTFDSMLTKMKKITDKEVVLIGDDRDVEKYQTLINYGAITSSNGTLQHTSEDSPLNITIENFI